MTERGKEKDSLGEDNEPSLGLRASSRDSQRRRRGGIRTPSTRDTTESGVSPSLSDLVREGSDTERRRTSTPRRKKKGKDKLSEENNDDDEGSEALSSAQDSKDDTIAQLMSMTLELQGQIREMQKERMMNAANSEGAEKTYRRGSIALTSKESSNNVVRALVPVPEEDKTKKATVYSIIELQTKMNEQQNQGIPTSIINYLSKSVLQKMLLWLSLGNAQEAGLQGYEFGTVEDLNKLTDSDIESILILMIRPNEKGMLIRLMKDIRVFVAKNQVNVNRPLYLQLKTTFQAVLEYLHLYEKIYKMMSGEMGLPVNGVVIGENVNTCIETMSKTQSDVKNPDNHEAILKATLVHGDILPLRLYNLLKGDPARGPAALVSKTAEMIEKIHPRRIEQNNKSTLLPAKSKAKRDAHHFHTHLCRYPDVKVEFGRVLLETMRHNLNIAVSVHDGVIQPFLAMMMPEVGASKPERTINMLGYILCMEEGCDERDDLIESLETTGDNGEHVKHCCFLQDELVKAQEAARVSELKCQELTTAEHSRIFNMVQNGASPVKIPTGFQNQHSKPKSIIQRPSKPCFAEAKMKGSCKRGSGCRYSHLDKDLEELRKNPVAANNLQVLGDLEDIPEAYDAAADSFSERY